MATSAFTADNIYLSISTPLGPDILLLQSFHGEEGLSRPFHFRLNMRSVDPEVDFTALVGKAATIHIQLGDKSKRHINGVISRFVQAGYDKEFTYYHAELRPWLWLLSLTTDSRIFQNKKVPDILKAVFSDAGQNDFKNALTGTYQPREYCVQYQETSFDFVSRLMEEEGIFYFFDHDDGKHTMVFADDADAHKPCPALTEAKIGQKHLIFECSFEQQVITTGHSMKDYNFTIPATNLFVKSGKEQLNIYDYPGPYQKKDEGERLVKLRQEASEQPEKTLRGQSRSRSFIAGYKFKLAGHERQDVNGEYVLRWVAHIGSLDKYQNKFEAFPLATPYRPPLATRRPVISGSQTAVVCTKKGEEIWTDKWGRVLVQFHWDLKGKNDEKSSCWIRVAQGWAGKTYGVWFLPRVGQEVVVSFLEGNPDRPLITGAVYNAVQKLPYDLPANQTRSTIKTKTTKHDAGAKHLPYYNELRFDDKKGKEEIYLQAQRDVKVLTKRNWHEDIWSHQFTGVGVRKVVVYKEHPKYPWKWETPSDTLILLKGKRVIIVEKGHEYHQVKGKRDVEVWKEETHKNKKTYTHLVKEDYTLKVKGNLKIICTKDITIKAGGKINISADKDISVKTEKNISIKAEMDIKIKAGKNIKSEAGMKMMNKGALGIENAGLKITSKADTMHDIKGGAMVSVKGALVKIN